MGDRTLVRWGRLLAGAAVATALVSVVVLGFRGGLDRLIPTYGAHNAVLAIGLGVLAWVSLPTQPRNREVWVLASAAGFAALFVAGPALLSIVAYDRFGSLSAAEILALVPSDLTLPEVMALQPTAWAWIPAFFLVLTLGLLWFPDGRLPSPRWRWVAWYGALVIAANVLFWVWLWRPGGTVPFQGPSTGALESVETALLIALVTGALASVSSLVVRYRRSSGDVRHQILWIAWGGAILLAAIFGILLTEGTPFGSTVAYLGLAAEVVLVGSFGVAITRYRLYDIDVVISRTVTFGVLAVFITGVYVVVVVGVGSLVGGSSLVLAVGATALVALLFEPIRSRVQGWANRLVFGERATPYAVLSELTARYASGESNEEALGRLAGLVASGTGAVRSVVWLRVGDRLRPEAVVGEGGVVTSVGLDAGGLPAVGVLGVDAVEGIVHGGELLGALSIVKDRADPVSPGDRQLLVDVAAGAGLLLRNIRLNAELADRADELRLSRRRLVAAQDAERRRLERNLHDGAQQQVVALKVKLGLARTLAERENLSEIADAVGELAADTQRAVDGMRTVARGIYPPLLEAEGLGAALAAVARDASFPVVVEADGVGRYPAEVEATVYFSVLEAIGQAAPSGGVVRVRVGDDAGSVRFTVAGITVSEIPGAGLSSVADRIDALGGVLTSDPATGTITGSLPTTALEPA